MCATNGKMTMVRCKICFHIERREKLLVLKLDLLIKHLGLRKCFVVKPRIIVGEYFLSPFNIHVKNEKVYGTTWQFNVIDQL
jgi:hypothetical protein